MNATDSYLLSRARTTRLNVPSLGAMKFKGYCFESIVQVCCKLLRARGECLEASRGREFESPPICKAFQVATRIDDY